MKLDDNSLSRCLEVNKWWKKFIDGTKIHQINQIQSHTHLKYSVLKKELSKKDFETVQKLANYCMKVHKKVIIDSMKYFSSNEDEQEKICRYLSEKTHRDKTQHLMTELMIKNTMNITPFRGMVDFRDKIGPIIRNSDFEVLQMMQENLEATSERSALLVMLVDFLKKAKHKVISESDKNDFLNSYSHNLLKDLVETLKHSYDEIFISLCISHLPLWASLFSSAS